MANEKKTAEGFRYVDMRTEGKAVTQEFLKTVEAQAQEMIKLLLPRMVDKAEFLQALSMAHGFLYAGGAMKGYSPGELVMMIMPMFLAGVTRALQTSEMPQEQIEVYIKAAAKAMNDLNTLMDMREGKRGERGE